MASLGASEEDISKLVSCYFFTVEFGICRSVLARSFLFLERKHFLKIMRKFRIKFSNTFNILILVQFPTELNKVRKNIREIVL
jgi:hypothetical protein